ncbi:MULTISPECIES: hypothetical protein [Klebsiella/Raoultella group]|uniref:hypothetical protein n=1 Tax=Klebsiella/Raoultella group TaxID=2890311 RepID=UPI002271490A|nr:hypothetical protein [Klebsiella michiganensis]HEC2576344.1 hypothetical protein [Raoultella ornithinolytica]ELT9746724.1 hypothetical protein [Klebsiella michiganensis]MCY0831082.1 hypothetical protein [Klebsiella michiganensis]MDD7828333.1 hypothetical protein [Klebsiella michiganensis]MDD7854481.1 hypothetical protein [Klebsiella michiganensis]
MDKEPVVIASFPQLIRWFDDEAKRLLAKSKEVRMLSYLFRRLSLYFGSALCFFILCLVMTFTKSVTLVMVNDWLSSVPEALRWWEGLVLLVITGFFTWYFRQRDRIAAIIFSSLILIALMTLFFVVLTAEQPVIVGISLAGSVTIMALIANKTLGFTRRDERYQLFSRRAKFLATFYRSQQAMNSVFTQENLQELKQFNEDLWRTKQSDTLSDSFYLLKKLEDKLRKD